MSDSATPPPAKNTWNGWELRPADQVTWLVLLAMGGIALGLFGLARWAQGHRWVDIDRAAQRTYRFQVELNQATWPELAQLPDLGETMARRIVDDRAQHGAYQRVDDLLRVEGIGEKTLDKLRPYVVVRSTGQRAP